MFEKSSRCGKRNKIRNGGFLCGKLKENVKYSNKKRMSTFCVSFSTIYCNKTFKICKINFFEHRDRSKLEYRGLYKSSKQVFSYTKLASHQITKVPSKNVKANIKVKGKCLKNTIYCPVISDTIVLIVILVILVILEDNFLFITSQKLSYHINPDNAGAIVGEVNHDVASIVLREECHLKSKSKTVLMITLFFHENQTIGRETSGAPGA